MCFFLLSAALFSSSGGPGGPVGGGGTCLTPYRATRLYGSLVLSNTLALLLTVFLASYSVLVVAANGFFGVALAVEVFCRAAFGPPARCERLMAGGALLLGALSSTCAIGTFSTLVTWNESERTANGGGTGGGGGSGGSGGGGSAWDLKAFSIFEWYSATVVSSILFLVAAGSAVRMYRLRVIAQYLSLGQQGGGGGGDDGRRVGLLAADGAFPGGGYMVGGGAGFGPGLGLGGPGFANGGPGGGGYPSPQQWAQMSPQQQQQAMMAVQQMQQMQQMQQQHFFIASHPAAAGGSSPSSPLQAPGGVTYAWRGGPAPGAAAAPGGAKELHFDDPIVFVAAPPGQHVAAGPGGTAGAGGARADGNNDEEEGEEPSANAAAQMTAVTGDGDT